MNCKCLYEPHAFYAQHSCCQQLLNRLFQALFCGEGCLLSLFRRSTELVASCRSLKLHNGLEVTSQFTAISTEWSIAIRQGLAFRTMPPHERNNFNFEISKCSRTRRTHRIMLHSDTFQQLNEAQTPLLRYVLEQPYSRDMVCNILSLNKQVSTRRGSLLGVQNKFIRWKCWVCVSQDENASSLALHKLLLEEHPTASQTLLSQLSDEAAVHCFGGSVG